MTTENDKDSKSDIDDLFIKLTQERTTQELNNLSADEMKVNVLVGVSVIFAVIAISGNLDFINANLDCFLLIPFFGGWATIIFSFILGMIILKPRKYRFTLWDPEKSKNYYDQMSIQDARKKIKAELIEFYKTIKESRLSDSKFIKFGFYLLFGGSIVILITSLLIKFFDSQLCPVVE